MIVLLKKGKGEKATEKGVKTKNKGRDEAHSHRAAETWC